MKEDKEPKKVENTTYWLVYTLGPGIRDIGALVYEGTNEDQMLMSAGRICLSGRRMNRIHVYRNEEKYCAVLVNSEENMIEKNDKIS